MILLFCLPRKVRIYIFAASIIFLLSGATAYGDRFKIGVSIPLSGSLAEYGQAAQNGMLLAEEEHPEKFVAIEFLFDDNRYDSKLAVGAFNRLVDLEKIDLLYMWGVEPVLAVVPLAKKKKVPVIALTQDPSVAVDNPYVIRFLNPAEEFSKKTLEYLRTKNVKHIGILKAEMTFCNLMVEGLRRNLAEGESIEIIESVLPSELDFKAIVTRLRSMSFDILGLYLVPNQVRSYYRQAQEQKLSMPIFGTTNFESRELIDDLGAAMNGSIFVHSSVSEDFRRRYTARFKNDAEIAYAANGYDFASLTAELFGKDPAHLGAEGILKAYVNSFEFKLVVKRILNGEIEEIPGT
ncbi:MAG: hypothetical protein DCC75_12645 [Proteobacteria bacterium]|nr:MAG: hypothetical protein DCC75_12645 [Pseudomonadota bacterium]